VIRLLETFEKIIAMAEPDDKMMKDETNEESVEKQEEIHEDITSDAASSLSPNTRRKLKLIIGISSFIIFLIVVITLILYFVVFKPKQPIGYDEYQEDLLEALRGRRSYLGDQSEDTPQGKALKWLRSDTGSLVDVSPPHIMVERYAMAVFFFATDGPNWEIRAGFLTQLNVCEWWNSKDEYLLCQDADQVTHINFFNNSLGGTLPTELGLLQRLLWFHLRKYTSIRKRNQKTISTFWSLIDSHHLVSSDPAANNIGGTIPNEIGELSALTSLVLAANKLTGAIPASIGRLTEIRTLEMEENQLGGNLPSEFGQLTHTQTLILGKNKLSGSIPSEIGRLVNASDLFLQSNELTGSIPDTIGDMTSLHFVYLQDNPSLTGSLEPLCSYMVSNSDVVFRAEADCRDGVVECSCCVGC